MSDSLNRVWRMIAKSLVIAGMTTATCAAAADYPIRHGTAGIGDHDEQPG